MPKERRPMPPLPGTIEVHHHGVRPTPGVPPMLFRGPHARHPHLAGHPYRSGHPSHPGQPLVRHERVLMVPPPPPAPAASAAAAVLGVAAAALIGVAIAAVVDPTPTAPPPRRSRPGGSSH
jgi:hypothetical protein